MQIENLIIIAISNYVIGYDTISILWEITCNITVKEKNFTHFILAFVVILVINFSCTELLH